MPSPPFASLSQLAECGFVPMAPKADAEIYFCAAGIRLLLRVTNRDGNVAFECDLPERGKRFAFTRIEALVAKVRFSCSCFSWETV